MGWANVGAAMAPDASLAAVASTIILILGGQGAKGIGPAIALAVPLAVAGLALTMFVRTATVFIAHIMDSRAEDADIAGIERWHFIGMSLQGLRVAIPALLLLLIPAHLVQSGLESMPEWLTSGMTIGGGMVVAVGYAMVINMMSSREVWPFFFLGFALAALKELTLISLGIIGLCLAVIDVYKRQPLAIPLVKVVLPAPRSPERTIISPESSSRPSFWPILINSSSF